MLRRAGLGAGASASRWTNFTWVPLRGRYSLGIDTVARAIKGLHDVERRAHVMANLGSMSVRIVPIISTLDFAFTRKREDFEFEVKYHRIIYYKDS
jgi:hypothetical protein